MKDRELLELAGKAAGMHVLMEGQKWPDDPVGWFFCQVGDNRPALYDRANGAMTRWAPLDDDGDALRLAVKLRLDICHNHPADQQPWVLAERQGCEGVFGPVCCVEDEFDEQERQRSTRCAIVRAAAAIQQAKEAA